MSIRKWIALIIVTSAFMACATPKALEYKTFHNFKINQLGFSSSSIGFDLEYFNPNNFGLQLKKTELDIFIDGNLLGHSITDSLIQIKKKSAVIIPVKFDVNMQNAFKNAWSTLSGKEVLLKLTGKVKMGKGNVFMSFPVNFETKQTFSLW